MKRHLYLFTLWTATLMVMLSTVMMHHHHEGRICFVEEKCTADGNVNDEHTGHQENEQEGCSLHQMQHFIINAKTVHSLEKHILDGGHLMVAVLPRTYCVLPPYSLTIARWQQNAYPLSEGTFADHYRRGPPTISLI